MLLVGALASADLGIDFDGTDFAFLEEWPFLLAVLVLVMLLELVRAAAHGRGERHDHVRAAHARR